MKRKVAGFSLSAALLLGASPFVGTAQANGDHTTDPVLCFVAAQAVITEALDEYRQGHLSGPELRSVLLGTASFLGDCLTPTG
jgi:hypothetical protein